MEKWYDNISPRISKILEIEARKSRGLVVHWGGYGHYQVIFLSNTCCYGGLEGYNLHLQEVEPN